MKHYWVSFTGCVDTCRNCGVHRFSTNLTECLQRDIDAYQKRLDPEPSEITRTLAADLEADATNTPTADAAVDTDIVDVLEKIRRSQRDAHAILDDPYMARHDANYRRLMALEKWAKDIVQFLTDEVDALLRDTDACGPYEKGSIHSMRTAADLLTRALAGDGGDAGTASERGGTASERGGGDDFADVAGGE